jgi:hypothetical protein
MDANSLYDFIIIERCSGKKQHSNYFLCRSYLVVVFYEWSYDFLVSCYIF